MRSHQQIDARSLAMHRLVAAKVRREPALFERAPAERWAFLREWTRSHAA
jgi:hypothetical protein